MKLRRTIFALLLLLTMSDGRAAEKAALSATELKSLTFDQKLNSELRLDRSFRDERGQSVSLKECVDGKPAILVFGYYQCRMLCNLVLNGVVEALQEIKPGADSGAHVIFISIDPSESPELARAKKANYLKRFGRAGSDSRWHFLTGEERAIRQVTAQAGFHYAFDAQHQEYAHPSGIVILTPEGRIARYFFGVSYSAAELQAALAEAASNRTSSPIQALAILCSRFVPLTGKFSGVILGAVRVIAVATVLAMAGVVLIYRGKTRRGCAAPKGVESA